MKILHVSFGYYPDLVGGTEVYVEALARNLKELGEEPVVAAPAAREGAYEHGGLPVRRYETSASVPLNQLYGEGDAKAAASFERLLDSEKPRLVHFHALTAAASVRAATVARKRGISRVFTYHTPTAGCQRGTLLRWGREVCDGVLRVGLCTRCTLQGLGAGELAARLLGSVPIVAGEALGKAGLAGGAWTALRMRSLMQLRRSAFHAFLSEMDRVVAVSEWARELLLRNGVPAEKLLLSRQGLPQPGAAAAPARKAALPVRLAAFGRLDPVKGFEVLIRAILRPPRLPVELDLFGIEQGGVGARHARMLRELAGGDGRIRFREPVAADRVPVLMRDHDLLAVPSVWLETGPLVVYEAFAAGIPVLGSRRGGVRELVQDGVNGLLVEAGSVEDWRRKLERVCSEPGLLERLRSGITPPRTMREVAQEMRQLYRQVVGS